jgi:hypothetical protein
VSEQESPQVGTAIARIAPELDQFARLGTWLAAAESDKKDPATLGAAASLRFFLAGELGLSPLAASELSMIRGRLVVSAKLVRALARNKGYKVVPKGENETSCTAALLDENDNEIGTYTYTTAQAEDAGLLPGKEGSGWVKSLDRMLWARASKRVVDDYAPEISLGLLSEEEAEEILVVPSPSEGDEGQAGDSMPPGGAAPSDASPPESSATTGPAEPDQPDQPDQPPEEGEVMSDDNQRKHFWALVRTDLKPWPAPAPAADWETYARMKMAEWYEGKQSITELSYDEAAELLNAMRNRLKEMQEAGPPPEKPDVDVEPEPEDEPPRGPLPDDQPIPF